jgi:hypothetical protein
MIRRKDLLSIFLVCANVTAAGQLKVKPSGFVGIGTNDPVTSLHVVGEGWVDSHAGTRGSALTVQVHYRNTMGYRLRNAYFDRDVFLVNGEGWLWSGQGHFVGSDSILMDGLQGIESPLNRVLRLKGASFRYADAGGKLADAPERLGLVAQEVERVVPQAVRRMPDSTLAVSYSDLVPLLIEAMKEQQQQIEMLRATLSGQEQQIAALKKSRRYREKSDKKEGAP